MGAAERKRADSPTGCCVSCAAYNCGLMFVWISIALHCITLHGMILHCIESDCIASHHIASRFNPGLSRKLYMRDGM